jgi:hypothetical protein
VLWLHFVLPSTLRWLTMVLIWRAEQRRPLPFYFVKITRPDRLVHASTGSHYQWYLQAAGSIGNHPVMINPIDLDTLGSGFEPCWPTLSAGQADCRYFCFVRWRSSANASSSSSSAIFQAGATSIIPELTARASRSL